MKPEKNHELSAFSVVENIKKNFTQRREVAKMKGLVPLVSLCLIASLREISSEFLTTDSV